MVLYFPSPTLYINLPLKKLYKVLNKISKRDLDWKMNFNPDSSKQAHKVIWSRKVRLTILPYFAITVQFTQHVRKSI